MRPKRADGTYWNALDANEALQDIKRGANKELDDFDIARGLPKNLACGRWVGRGKDRVFRVDPVLSRLKHSGQQAQALIRKRWAEFCSQPRDPEVELAKIGKKPTPDESTRMRVPELGPAIQAAIAEGIKAGVAAALSNGHSASAGPATHAKSKRALETVETT